MYIYQNNKLYVQEGDTLVGVEIHPDKILRIDGETARLSNSAMYLTLEEVIKKFQINLGKTFGTVEKVAEPVVQVTEKPEGEENVTIDNTEKPRRRADRK